VPHHQGSPLPERELDELMDRLAGGDRQAFEPIFRALWPRALAAANRRLETQGAADAAQCTMMKLFSHASEFERGSPVLPWFYAIAGNEIRAALRRIKPQAGVDAALHITAGEDPQQLAIDRELRRALARALESLDAESAEAIAAVLGDQERPAIESAAFRKRVSRAYAKLRILLGGHHER
jgi:RNA polymerase sigma-70 factor (ECF subfamily)